MIQLLVTSFLIVTSVMNMALHSTSHTGSSFMKIPDSEPPNLLENIKTVQSKIKDHAETALLSLAQYYQQFPLCGGPDYSNSMVSTLIP